ncbi:MAG: hypothetical protein JWN66_3190 [Sphingomonas bacterium]|nr:hypothetical protein [Sphingomonas bacterium]MDB5706074.1 hypothetical protein [Sphingomonas bacterium]
MARDVVAYILLAVMAAPIALLAIEWRRRRRLRRVPHRRIRIAKE